MESIRIAFIRRRSSSIYDGKHKKWSIICRWDIFIKWYTVYNRVLFTLNDTNFEKIKHSDFLEKAIFSRNTIMLMYAYLTYKVNSGLDMLIIKRTQIVLRKHDDLKMLFFWSDPVFFMPLSLSSLSSGHNVSSLSFSFI